MKSEEVENLLDEILVIKMEIDRSIYKIGKLFDRIYKLASDNDEMRSTLEVLSNPEAMEQLKQSKKDIAAGRTRKLGDIKDFK